MPSEYDLLLHCQFYLNPHKIEEVRKAYPDLAQWMSGLDGYCARMGLQAEQVAFLKKVAQSFNYDQFISRLDREEIQVLDQNAPLYPTLLNHIPDPPHMIFYKGDISRLSMPLLGVVGPRQPSDYGRQAAAYLVKSLARQFGIVSGLAAGVDAIAHRTCLAEGQYSVAVMGTSFDTVYPTEHRGLFSELCAKGLVISEYPFGIQTKGYHFSRRNRLISGLSKGVLIVEAGEKSGALVTARNAVEQNREVFVVPGSIFSEQSVGTHRLIQDGAKLVTKAEDVVNEFYEFAQLSLLDESPEDAVAAPMPDLSEDEVKILACFTKGESHGLDALCEQSGLMIHMVLQALTLLEMNGLVGTLPGQRYERIT